MLIASLSLASIVATLPHVAPGAIDRVVSAATTIAVALSVVATLALVLVAPLVGVLALVALAVAVVQAEGAHVAPSPYGRSAEPATVVTVRAPALTPTSVSLAPHPLALTSSVGTLNRLSLEIDAVTASLAKATASRHRARARKLDSRLVTLVALRSGVLMSVRA